MSKLIKISDDFFEGIHPNDINVGFTQTHQHKLELPVVGERYYPVKRWPGFSTSIVKEILSQDETGFTFKTTYSTYKVEY